MGVIILETENDKKIIDNISFIKNNLEKPGAFKGSDVYAHFKKNALLVIFYFPRSVYFEVISFFLSIVLVSSIIFINIINGGTIKLFQILILVLWGIVYFFSSDLFLSELYKLNVKKNTDYKGKIKRLSHKKALKRLYFDN